MLCMIGRGTHLDLGPQDNMRISGIGQAKNAAKLVHRQLPNVANLQLRRLGSRVVCKHHELECIPGCIRTCVPISSSTTSILSAMTGGLLPLLRADSSICMAFVWNCSENRGHLKVNDMEVKEVWILA